MKQSITDRVKGGISEMANFVLGLIIGVHIGFVLGMVIIIHGLVKQGFEYRSGKWIKQNEE